MGYEPALKKSWDELLNLKSDKLLSVRFLGDDYTVDTAGRQIVSLSCNVPAREFTAILILHYLIEQAKGVPAPSGEWLSFKELSGIEGYYPAFKQRALEPVIRKFGKNPAGLVSVLERLPGTRAAQGDVAVVIDAFRQVPVLVILWKGDEEFGPEANMLFDRTITRIFCTEDIVVLAGIVAHAL